ncbi:PAS domain-containing protein [Sphingomonas sp. GB1N7]|uniref:PAS domain-containing protein n=1 Tax=Parasphingomonas caseinilytica TaxID=3096158 RepID=UPI002FCA807E
MDNVRGFDGDLHADEIDLRYDEPVVSEPKVEIGTDERRMHVRAYNHWVSLLRGRAYPSIEDLDPANIADFGPHAVLLDFSRGIEDPVIAYLGSALRAECDLDSSVTLISQVPSRSLLSRLTDHYLQIIANRAPIGFEAEFVSQRGFNTMYRGILMPFSSDEDTIDFIYGVINWKELVDAETQAQLDAEVQAAVRATPQRVVATPVWADGPSAEREESGELELNVVANLADQLMLAQQTAAAVRAADTRTRSTLYRALGRAHDFAAAADRDPAAYEALLDQAGITLQLRAPMTPIVKLVFGADYDKTRLTEYAAVLGHARRVGVDTGALGDFLDSFEGGIKGVVQAERALRQPVAKPATDHRAKLAKKTVLADVTLETGVADGDYVVLLARSNGAGGLQVVAAIGDAALTEKAMRAAA